MTALRLPRIASMALIEALGVLSIALGALSEALRPLSEALTLLPEVVGPPSEALPPLPEAAGLLSEAPPPLTLPVGPLPLRRPSSSSSPLAAPMRPGVREPLPDLAARLPHESASAGSWLFFSGS